jgi:membrane protease YdiL (CAAX protease family)
MMQFNRNKPYVIDPEPMLTAGQSLALLFTAFLVSNIIAAIFGSKESIFILSFIVEIGIYFIPPLVIAMILKYRFNDIFRWRNYLRLDLIMITIFSAIFMIIISAKIMEIVETFAPISPEELEWQRSFLMPGGNIPFILVFTGVAIVPGICEELLFRGVVQPSFIKRIGPTWGILLTAAIFALFHVQPKEFAALFVLGIFLGVLAFRGGSFLYSSLAHIIFNGAAVIGTALQEHGKVKMQNGGISTPYALLILFLFILAMLLLFRLTPKHRVGEPDMYHI